MDKTPTWASLKTARGGIVRTANCTYIAALRPSNLFRFEGQSETGELGIVVEPETIKQLAKILMHTDKVGHAAWHLSSPETPLPCIMCELEPNA